MARWMTLTPPAFCYPALRPRRTPPPAGQPRFLTALRVGPVLTGKRTPQNSLREKVTDGEKIREPHGLGIAQYCLKSTRIRLGSSRIAGRFRLWPPALPPGDNGLELNLKEDVHRKSAAPAYNSVSSQPIRLRVGICVALELLILA